MPATIQIGDLTIEVTHKAIRNVHLSVHPPSGKIRVSAPQHLSLNAVRAFAIGKLAWIKQQQGKLQEQEREMPREYLERESHFVWGRRCLLHISERNAPPAIAWQLNRLTLGVRPGTSSAKRADILEEWYRAELREAALDLLPAWEKRIGVKAGQLFIQRMKTRWGGCNPATGAIRLNTDLAKKPRECLEYILVHELVHLLEPTHNQRFVGLMDKFLPNWSHRRALLNRLPLRHVDWEY